MPRRDVICPDQVKETLLHWKGTKKENIMTYRDNTYPSLVTGKMALVPRTPWLEAKDDSPGRFVQIGQRCVSDQTETPAREASDRHHVNGNQQSVAQICPDGTVSEFLLEWKRTKLEKIRTFRDKLQNLAEATAMDAHQLPEPSPLVWQKDLSGVARLRG